MSCAKVDNASRTIQSPVGAYVRLLRNMRLDRRRLGGDIRFGTKVTKMLIQDGKTKGGTLSARSHKRKALKGRLTLGSVTQSDAKDPVVSACALVDARQREQNNVPNIYVRLGLLRYGKPSSAAPIHRFDGV